jgi:NADH-quinone oxidoreductase subunit L
VKQNHVPVADETKRTALAQLSYHKFYIDETYDLLIRRPLDAISAFFYRVFDKKIVDGIVNGLGWSTSEASKGVRLLQSGNVGFYIFMMVAGIISLLLYTYLSL